jgi:hypothetical protein
MIPSAENNAREWNRNGMGPFEKRWNPECECPFRRRKPLRKQVFMETIAMNGNYAASVLQPLMGS